MAITFPIVRLNINNQTIEFRDTDIIDAEVVQEIHPIGIELPASSATIRIYITDPRFSPFSEGEFYDELVNNLTVDVYESIDEEEVYLGRFYLAEWRNPSEHEFEFVCQDAVGVLDSIVFDGMFWETAVSLEEAVGTVLNPAGIPYMIDEEIASRPLKGYLPAGKTREALQQILFAGRAVAITAQSDKIVITDAGLPAGGMNEAVQYYGDPLYGAAFFGDAQYDGVITSSDKTDKQKLQIEPLVTGIQLVSHDYAKSLTQEEIFKLWLEPGDHKLPFPKPFYDVTAEGVGATPAYLMTENPTPTAITTEDNRILSFEGAFEFGANYIFLHVKTAGNVIVRGYPWLDNKLSFVYDESEATKQFSSGVVYGEPTYGESYYAKFWQVSASPNVWKVDQATLVSADIAPLVMEKLITFAKLRYRQDVTLFPREDVKPGNIELVDSLYDKDINGIVKRTVSDLTGGFLIDTELIGAERMV